MTKAAFIFNALSFLGSTALPSVSIGHTLHPCAWGRACLVMLQPRQLMVSLEKSNSALSPGDPSKTELSLDPAAPLSRGV